MKGKVVLDGTGKITGQILRDLNDQSFFISRQSADPFQFFSLPRFRFGNADDILSTLKYSRLIFRPNNPLRMNQLSAIFTDHFDNRIQNPGHLDLREPSCGFSTVIVSHIDSHRPPGKLRSLLNWIR